MSRRRRRGGYRDTVYISLRSVTLHIDGIRAAILTPHRTAMAFCQTTVFSWPAADWTVEHLLEVGRDLVVPVRYGETMTIERVAPKHLDWLIRGGELSPMDALRVLSIAARQAKP